MPARKGGKKGAVKKRAPKSEGTAAAVSFQTDVKPYFTACYRQHMLFFCDLWSLDDVQSNWDDINTRVKDGSMPRAGCPEGVWNNATRQKFLSVFGDWKNANFPP